MVEPGTRRIRAWADGIPLSYKYTVGAANEVFLRGLKDAKIIASKCASCGEVRLPPRIYCLQCYRRTRIDVEVLHLGRIAALSSVPLPSSARKAGLAEARSWTTFGFVRFEGVGGGLVHRIIIRAGRKRGPQVGDPVCPRFVAPEERRGSILDLEGFRMMTKR